MRPLAMAVAFLALSCHRREHHVAPPPECPTREKFEALKDGMSHENVDGFLGMTGLVKTDVGGTMIVNYICHGPRRRITVVFEGDRLANKTEDGL